MAVTTEGDGDGWDDRVLFTLYAFGLLRQTSAVRLVTLGDPSYAGFTYVDSPEKLGTFVALQNTVVWTQIVTQEMSKPPVINSYRAGVRLACTYRIYKEKVLGANLASEDTYGSACGVFQAGIPGVADFCSENIVEVVLNAIQHSGLPRNNFPHHLLAILDHYVFDPDAIFGPGAI